LRVLARRLRNDLDDPNFGPSSESNAN